MTATVEIPVWLFVLIVLFAAVTAASHLLFPSVRWFFRRRLERAVARLNERLERPIQPFKLARRHDMIQRLIYNPEVNRAIVQHARDEQVPENVAFESAHRYAREIVPSFSATLYFGIAIRVARGLSNSLYRVQMDRSGSDTFSSVDPDATVVFVINHRSNMDYVLVTYLAAERSALSYAVGEWARVWPLSRLIRAMGAYFIRRRSRNPLYRKVLAQYVRMATDAGVTQAIFPEGGLSLDGKPAEPKVGLLKYLIDGWDPNGRDVVFVPVALNYDRVLEDSILISAGQEERRRFRARIGVVAGKILYQIWYRLRGRYHRFGYASVRYGEPVSLIEYAKDKEGDIAPSLARTLIDDVAKIIPVLPVPMLARLMLQRDDWGDKDLSAQAQIELEALGNVVAPVPVSDLPRAIEHGLRHLSERKIISRESGRVVIQPGRRAVVEYYANTIAHLPLSG